MKSYLKEIVEVNKSIQSRIFDIFIQVLIILSVISFSIETLPTISTELRKYLRYFELFCVFIFTLEYIARIYVANKKISYIFSFYGIIDLLSILPYFLGLFFDARQIKAFRLFRLFRLLKLTKYNKSLVKFETALRNSKEEFILFFVLALIMFYLASVGIYFFENKAQPEAFQSVFHSMWWAVATLTTVGYGDIYPITLGGRIFTTFMLLIGLGIVGIPAGIIASALTEINENEKKKD